MPASTQLERGAALWHPQAHMPSVVGNRLTFVRGDGCYLETEDGRRLFDVPAGLWYANVGHGREELAEAAARQLRTLETYHTFGRFGNDRALDLADRVAGLAPIADAKVFWTSGGSDAVDTAAKLARRWWQHRGRGEKRIVLSRRSAYHGLHAFGTSLAGLDFNREGYGVESLIPETARVATNDLDAVAATIEQLGPERIAALFAEPIVGTGGVIHPAPGYLEGLQELCRAHDILFVVDEVITGFGRTGHLFASERFGLSPDMLLFAKGITSGYIPLGGALIAPRLWEPFFDGPDAPIFRHGLTYSGHATACAVADVNLDILERERLIPRAAELEGALERALRPLEEHPLVAEVRAGVGFIAGVQLVADAPHEEIAQACVERGFVMRVITDGTLQICPPFVATDDEVAAIGTTIAEALDAVAAHV